MIDRKFTGPPKSAEKFFRWYCRNELRESILGDLQERFDEDVSNYGPGRAKLKFWINVLRFISRHTVRSSPRDYKATNRIAMIKNYLVVALRSMKRNYTFSLINIFGLALGLACCIVIFFYVRAELNFDRVHSKADRIYRVNNQYIRASKVFNWTMTPPALASALKDNFPELEKVTRLRFTDEHHFSVGDRSFYETEVFYADSTFLEIFDFQLTKGDRSALDQPNSIVMTESAALKYFGTEDPMGKVVMLDNVRSLIVTGILEDIEGLSHLNFDLLISFQTYRVPDGYLADLNSWGWSGFLTYILLNENASVPNLQDKVKNLFVENFNRNSINLEVNILLQSLSDIYLGSNDLVNIDDKVILTGNIMTVYTLAAIAFMILLIAGFNFMNLSTAMSFSRSKEIGVRKIMGALRGRVAAQFLFESTIVGLISLMIAAFLVFITRPLIQSWIGIHIPSDWVVILKFTPVFLLSGVLIGLLAGIYPSIILSAFSPINALKGTNSPGTNNWIRKTLVVFQFAISVSLIAASLILTRQMNFIRDKSLGFDKESVLQLRMNRDIMSENYDELRNLFLQNPRVIDLAQVSHQLDGSLGSGPARLPSEPESSLRQLDYLQTDYDFLQVMNIELIAGRFFEESFTTDSAQAILLNETAVAEFGFTEPVGKDLIHNGRERTIIGVYKDFHYRSLHTSMSAMAMVMPFVQPEFLYIKLAPGNIRQSLDDLASDWISVVGNVPFDASFLDDNLNEMYEREEKLTQLINIFSGLAVLLACLGLYGLVAFAVNNKLKEVGIRKVLGASIGSLLVLLSKHFVVLIVLANLIAWPITWLAAEEWLTGFAYRIEIGPEAFFLAALVLLLIALLTISHQTIRAALTNPVKVLRNE